MPDFAAPDATTRITLDTGHEVVAYSWGEGEPVVLLSGGPGLPCRYLAEPHLRLVDQGFRVVSYDQLGTGASDRPTDPALWTVARFATEVDQVLRALDLERPHLLGHSWGGWLGMEFAVTFPGRLKSLTLADTAGDIPHLVSELNRLRDGLGIETVRMMQRREALGQYDHPEYEAAITLLTWRHMCRLDVWPEAMTASVADWNMAPYMEVQGPNEFHYIGNLSTWNRLAELGGFDAPALVLCGAHDEMTPACALRLAKAIPGAELEVFPNSAHCPFYEEPEAYFARVAGFLKSASA
ncbi:proline iminopeptidase-family hydrolase [Albimonas sp. CAU 1670]|uniref:proline iminopeptidase-family hydrolase n=1 Tax=Albimonas sp. CAU 1670 TaxID=3032599 RepID=UPI0023DBA69E|nr:proline iminopeptidase-family hydrolase [Albimonas sp. CAU 1670]MDF2233773.1 proline iminopeptidase-family hydrolase [Albimonas sp. CAU 1670]